MVIQNTVRSSDSQHQKRRKEICLQAIEILKQAEGRASKAIPELEKLVSTVGLTVVVTRGRDRINKHPVYSVYIATCRTDPDHVHVQIRKDNDTVEYSRAYGVQDRRQGNKEDRRNRACIRRRRNRRQVRQAYSKDVRLYNSGG